MSDTHTTEPVLKIEGLSIAYEPGRYAVKDVSADSQAQQHHCHHGPLRMRQEHPAQGHEQDA